MAPLPNPAAASNLAAPQETNPFEGESPLAEWQEPAIAGRPLSRNTLMAIIGGSAGVAILMIILGIFAGGFNFYFGAVVAIAAGISLVMQSRGSGPGRTVVLTNRRLIVGNRSYALEGLAGFWLQDEPDHVQVNVEPSKAALVPVSFATDGTPEEIRNQLLQALPEVEARRETFSDRINRSFRL
jgi:hypothetical protein